MNKQQGLRRTLRRLRALKKYYQTRRHPHPSSQQGVKQRKQQLEKQQANDSGIASPVLEPRRRGPLLALLLLLAAPIPIAWSMWYFQLGVPEKIIAKGELLSQNLYIQQWQLNRNIVQPAEPVWHLLFFCREESVSTNACILRDKLWRLHRSLGRDAPRLQRWVIREQTGSTERVGQDNTGSEYQGEQQAFWLRHTQNSDVSVASDKSVSANTLNIYNQKIWLADPQGQLVLAYHEQVALADILADLRHVFKHNPLPPQWQARYGRELSSSAAKKSASQNTSRSDQQE